MEKTLKFQWDAVSGAVGYRLYRAAGSNGFIFAKQYAVVDVSENEVVLVDYNIPSGDWRFVVVAYDKHNIESPVSNEVTVLVPEHQRLSAPIGFKGL